MAGRIGGVSFDEHYKHEDDETKVDVTRESCHSVISVSPFKTGHITKTPQMEYILPDLSVEIGYQVVASCALGLVYMSKGSNLKASIEPVTDSKPCPRLKSDEILLTPVVSVCPQDVVLDPSRPAIIELTKSVEPTCLNPNRLLIPMYSPSHSSQWEELVSHDCEMLSDRIRFNTVRFGFHTVVIRFPFPSASTIIDPNIQEQATIVIQELPGFKVEVSPASVQSPTEITATVVYDNSHVMEHFKESSLASACIRLEPHRIQFKDEAKISVPIPDYNLIKQKSPRAKLEMWLSESTDQGEPITWTPIHFTVHLDDNGNCLATACITHFSYLTTFWKKTADVMSFFTAQVRSRCRVFMSAEKRFKSFLTFGIVVILTPFNEPCQVQPHYSYLLFDSVLPIDIAVGEVECQFDLNEIILRTFSINRQQKSHKEIVSMSRDGNMRAEFIMELQSDATSSELPAGTTIGTLLIKDSRRNDHRFTLIKPFESTVDSTKVFVDAIEKASYGLKRSIKEMKQQNHTTLSAWRIATHLQKVAKLACNTSGFTGDKITDIIQMIVKECEEIEKTSKQIAETCTEPRLRENLEAEVWKVLSILHSLKLSLRRLKMKQYSEKTAIDAIELLTTNAMNLTYIVEVVLYAADRAIIKVPKSQLERFIPQGIMLGINDLHRVLTATWGARAKWYNCGLALGLTAGTLDAIRETHRGACDNCFTEILKEWLQKVRPPPSSLALCIALEDPSVGHDELAESLILSSGFSEFTEKKERSSTYDINVEQSDKVSPSKGEEEGIPGDHMPKEDQITTSSGVFLGHILTKVELQVLSGLLDAYSNEKIREIQQSIQKKQGGDISREEVERSLRDGGLTTVADELEQNLHKGVEKAQHYETYKSALEGAKTLTLRYLRLLFIGIPRSGKSTMRRRMLHEIINLGSLGQPSFSTGVAETYDVLVKKMTSEAAAISGTQWWSLKKRSNDADHDDEGDLQYLIHLYYSLICKPTTDAAPKGDSATNGEQHTNTSTVAVQIENDTTTQIGVEVAEQDTEIQPVTIETADKSVPEEPASQSDSDKEINTAFEKLTDILHSDSPEDFHELLQALTLINMMDIGGQPEFLDMLPALTIGAALYLLFFRLDRDLHESYPVTFHAPGDTDEKTLETSYCIEEVIHQALASIACFGCYTSTSKDKSSTSCAALFGTYSDQVTPAEIAEKEKAVKEQFFSSEMCKKLLRKTSKGRPFFTVDNINGTDESEMSEIRTSIDNIVKTYFAEVPIPASWLMFRIVLHLLNKPVVSLAQCEEIACRLSMPTTAQGTPVQAALSFFHHNIGSLLYYPDIPSVKDLVICTPQVIFDSISTVIIENFQYSKFLLPEVIEQFQQTGLFSLSDISKKTEQYRSTHLSPNQLVDVLKHNSILAEVKCDDDEATPVEPKFIIPAVLKHALEEELKPSASLEACPLVIRFEGGFLPFGVFSASIARLIANAATFIPRWSLNQKEVKKNKVKFLVAGAFVVTLICRPKYLEIQVEKFPKARCKHTLAYVCCTVRKTFVETLETTISKMKYRPQDSIAATLFSNQQPFELAFTCCLDYPVSHNDHLMRVCKEDSESYGKCVLTDAETELGKEQLMWFNEDKLSSQSERSTIPKPHLGCLSINELNTVKNVLWDVRTKWKDIGDNLGVDPGSIDAIAKEYREVPDDCFREVISTWLRMASTPSKPVTWAGLVAALEQKTLKGTCGAIVDHIRKKYLMQS